VHKSLWAAALALAACAGLFIAAAQQPAAQPATKTAAKGFIQGRLTWFDRQGKVLGSVGEPSQYRTLSVSPDGKQVAVERTDPQTENRDIWLYDTARRTSTRFTSDPGWEAFPVWSPDGRRIIFTSNRAGQFDLYQKAVDSKTAEELFFKTDGGKGPTGWSPDGRFLIYYTLGQPTHLMLLPFAAPASGERKPVPLIDTKFSSVTGRFSPDGRWIAYTSNESGKNEISVRPFDSAKGVPGPGDPIFISNGGGTTPLWRGDGKEIFYIAAGTVMAVEVDARSGFKPGAPKPLFKVPAGLLFWDVARDSVRFVLPMPDGP
jgi:Tol biopolymer transport system component